MKSWTQPDVSSGRCQAAHMAENLPAVIRTNWIVRLTRRCIAHSPIDCWRTAGITPFKITITTWNKIIVEKRVYIWEIRFKTLIFSLMFTVKGPTTNVRTTWLPAPTAASSASATRPSGRSTAWTWPPSPPAGTTPRRRSVWTWPISVRYQHICSKLINIFIMFI